MRFKMMSIVMGLVILLPFISGIGTSGVQASDEVPAPTSNMRTVGQFSPYLVIDDFESEDSLANWHAGENVADVSLAEQTYNVFFPYEGKKFLAIKSEPNLQNNVWRTVSRTFDQPLDLSNSRYLMMAFNHFGYLPNDDPYYARLKVYSGDSSIEGIVRVYNNQWNKIGIDISGWAGRNAIDKLEVSFQHAYDRADHPDDPLPYWPNTEFYIDYVHAANDLGWQFSYDNDSEGWMFNDSISTPVVSGGRLDFAITGPRPTMTSAPMKLDSAENNLVTLKLKNQSNFTSGKLYWTTAADPNFDESKSQSFELVANDNEMRDYAIRLIRDPSWSGQITGIRLQWADGSPEGGTMSIDGIDFAKQDRPIYDYIGHVTNIRVDANTVTVTGDIGADVMAENGELQLYELAPYQYEPDIASLTPVQTIQTNPSENRNFQFTLSRYDGQRDRYYSKYLVILRTPTTDTDQAVSYIDRPKSVTENDFPADHQFPYPKAMSKKGLNVQMSDDAEELGVAHATLTVVVNGLMYKDNVDPNNAIEYDVEGVPYYFHKDAVEELDREIKAMSDNGTIVYLVLILYNADDPNGSTNVLIHPDAARGQGTVYAFNTSNDAGIQYFKAAMEFLSDRYTREDEKYGRAMGYIIGNEVDSAWMWQNMGDKTVDRFMEEYERTVRLAYQAVRKHSDSARVYISLDNAWNEPYFANQPTRFYKGRDIIDLMNQLSKQGGDFPWNVAYHAYPENMLNPRTWDDHEYVTDQFDTPKISFKNLQVLDQYMNQEQLQVNGEPRRIILSEQGFQTPDSSLDSQKLQAAAYTYAYYKTKFQPGIDAFILFNQLDISSAGLNMGLWTQDTEMAGFVAKDQKYIYDVFKYIDTSRSLEVTDFAKSIIGIDDWSEVIPDFDPSQLAERIPAQLVPLSLNKRAPDLVQGDHFDIGMDGWEPADHSNGIGRITTDAYSGDGSLKVDFTKLVRMTFVGLEKLWKGADKKFDHPVDATESPYLNVAVKLTDPLESQPYYVKVRVYSGDRIAEGIARIDTAKGWNDLSLDLSGWEGVGAIDRIKIWTRKTTSQSWSGSLLIDEVGFSKKQEAVGGTQNLDITVSAENADLAPGTAVTIKVTNYDASKLTGEMQIEPIGNLVLSENKLMVNGLATGQTQTFTLRIVSHDLQGDESGIRFKYRSAVLDALLPSGS